MGWKMGAVFVGFTGVSSSFDIMMFSFAIFSTIAVLYTWPLQFMQGVCGDISDLFSSGAADRGSRDGRFV
jgi:hypothetical protein